MEKIKSIKQKISASSFSDPIPFGADGVNIDMASGLNLEEQFKLGGLENYTISETSSGTEISSTYKNNAGNIINIITYKIVENISTGTTITASLKDSSGNSVIRTKQFTIAPPSSDGMIAIASTWVTTNNETQGGD